MSTLYQAIRIFYELTSIPTYPKTESCPEKSRLWPRRMEQMKRGLSGSATCSVRSLGANSRKDQSTLASLSLPTMRPSGYLPCLTKLSNSFRTQRYGFFYPAADKKGGEGFSQQDIPTKLLGRYQTRIY